MRTNEEMRRLEAMGTYTDDEINRLARGGKHRGHIPGVGRVLPARATASPNMFSQFESGGASGCGDEEEGTDHQDDEDEDGDGDTQVVRDPNKTPNSSQQPPHDCLKCGNPVDGLYCRQCALLQKKLKEDPGKNSSQSPPHIDHNCCYGCGDPLDGIFYRRCTCESCGNGAHICYNFPPKVPIISNPEPCHNQNVDEFLQTLPSFHSTCYFGDEISFAYDSTSNFIDDPPNVFNQPSQPLMNSYEFCGNDAHYSYDFPPQSPVIHQPPQETSAKILHDHENVINSVQTFLRKFNRFSFLKTPKVLLLAWDRVSEIKDAFGNKQYKLEDMQELFRKLFNDVQNIHEELVEYINTSSWNRPAFSNYDDGDDEDYTIAITPEEPDNSLSMGDEHLDTIPATKSDEVIKSSVENLVPIPIESEGIPDNMCDVPFCDNSPPLDISKDQFEDFSDSNDDSNSIDDDYFSIDNIDYVKASPPDSELVSLDGEIKDDNLYEKLLNIHLLVAKIESLNDNPTPDRGLESPSLFPIHIEDSDSLFEKSDTSLSYSDNSLPEFETFSDHTVVMKDILGEPRVHVPNVLPTHPTLILDLDFIPSDNSLPESEIFYFDIGEKNSGSTTIHADISLSDVECFNFKSEPDRPVVPPYLLSSGNEDTIFNPDISIYHSFMPSVSHRSRTFMKFNVYPNHLNESPMKILSSTCFPMDQ
uniref:F-box domain, leucine-rich repeat domain, L domain-like protein n=1 Tax=Tanacetum cinerariifolium TaxID=118510 RepID=A0A699HV67_TANCI|nr:F-box domain, leucine-rich repeat domain, L domain-like protein [Tanacetum cinerariifolium]